MIINQRVGRFLLKSNCEYSLDFIYYLVSSKSSYEYFSRIAYGAAQPNISGSLIESLEFPNINFQNANKIGEILKTLDQKIHLNQQTNQTLEHIAQAIFKSWFVDFDPVRAKADCLANGGSMADAHLSAMGMISGKSPDELSQLQADNPQDYDELWQLAEHFPCELVENAEFGEVPKGWESATLSAICKMQNGYAFKSSDWRDEGVPVIKIGSVKPMIVEVEGNGFVNEDNLILRSNFILKESDILVGLTGYVGEVGRMPKNKVAMLNQRVAKFQPLKIKQNTLYYSYVYCLARNNSFKSFAEANAKGSAQANISTKELLSYPIILANDEIHLSFEKVIQTILDMIISNSGENEQLTKIRDELLPKLLSEEIEL